MAWFRSRRSPYQGGMIVSGVMSASWAVPMLPSGSGSGGLDGQRGAVRAVEGEPAAGRGGDEVAAVVDHLVVPGAQADQVVQVGAAAVGPVLDVVQVGPAGLAAGEPAPAAVAFPGGAADRGAGPAAAPAQGQDGAGVAVGHPGQGGGAGEHLRGGHADRRAVLDVAPGRVGRVAGDPGRGGRRFRGNAGVRGRDRRPGERVSTGMHHDLIDLGVVGPGDLPGQERLRDRDQAVGQVRGRPDGLGGAAASGRVSAAGVSGRRAFPRKRPARGSPARSAQAARSAFSSTAPCRGGSRNVPDSDPSSSNRQASRRRTRASASSARVTWRCARANRSSWFAVIGPASSARPASVAGAAIRVSARTLAYDSRPAANRARITGRSRSARATRTCSRAVPDDIWHFHDSHCAQEPISHDAQPRRASKSASRTRNRHVAAARCPASSQICASSRSSGTRAGSAGDAATSAGGETAAKMEPDVSLSNMYFTLAAGSDKMGRAGHGVWWLLVPVGHVRQSQVSAAAVISPKYPERTAVSLPRQPGSGPGVSRRRRRDASTSASAAARSAQAVSRTPLPGSSALYTVKKWWISSR